MISTTSSDESEATKPKKKYRNAGLCKDWNAKPARPVVAKSVSTPLPDFKLGGLDNDDITDIPPALAVGQAVGRVAAGGSRIRVACRAPHIWIQSGMLSTTFYECLTLTFHGLLQLAIAAKVEHNDSNTLKPKVSD